MSSGEIRATAFLHVSSGHSRFHGRMQVSRYISEGRYWLTSVTSVRYNAVRSVIVWYKIWPRSDRRRRRLSSPWKTWTFVKQSSGIPFRWSTQSLFKMLRLPAIVKTWVAVIFHLADSFVGREMKVSDSKAVTSASRKLRMHVGTTICRGNESCNVRLEVIQDDSNSSDFSSTHGGE